MSGNGGAGSGPGFQQQNGWSFTGNRSTGLKGRMAPGPLPGWAGSREQIREDEDAPVSPGTKPALKGSNGYFDSTALSSYPQPATSASSKGELPSQSIASIAPWETDPGAARLNGPFGSYSEAWSENRPNTPRAYTSDTVGSAAAAEVGHRRSISDRLRQETQKRQLRQGQGQGQGQGLSAKSEEKSLGNRKKSATTSAVGGFRSREPSSRNFFDAATPSSLSRPKTPSASAEVAPWEFQELTNVPRYGDAPVRQVPPVPDLSRVSTANLEAAAANARPRGFGHRKTSSRDDGSTLRLQQSASDLGDRARLSSKQSRGNLNPFSRRQTDMLAASSSPRHDSGARFEPRATSPVPSTRSTATDGRSQLDGSGSTGSGKKGGIFGRIGRHLHLHDKPQDSDDGKPTLYSGSQDQIAPSVSDASTRPSASREYSIVSDESTTSSRPGMAERRGTAAIPKKESKARLFHRDRGRSDDKKRSGTSDGGVVSRGGASIKGAGTYFDLDTNLDDMDGILNDRGQPHTPFHSSTPGPGVSYFDPVNPMPNQSLETPITVGGTATWDAPDSWGVTKDDPTEDKVSVIKADETLTEPGDLETLFCIRIFQINHTFATLALPLRSVVSDVLEMLGKKSFLQDDLGNYHIVMRKGELQRQLQPSERPVMIQRSLLQQAGYLPEDHIDKEGQDDNSYLCRFTFVPTKISGPYSLDRDSGLEFERMSKFSNIDLSSRSLTAIPIVLYKKSSEIVSLNLSRNLALDVPRDFIQSCTHLKEIRYTGNEARQLPPSFSLASKLQVLDVSHNEIDQLDSADLGRLSQLVQLKLANNALNQLPLYFTQFKQLRSLTLSSNSFKRLPNWFGEMRSLVDLDISFNLLESWPSVEELVNLERFWATNNNLNGDIPDEYRNLINLKDIDVRFNNINSIDAITHLPHVEQLAAGHNHIIKFEGFFPRMRTLQLDHNPMTRFDVTLPMPALTTLNLASNALTSLDRSIFEKLSNLTKLNLDSNQFPSLPVEIGRLSKLVELTIAKNRLGTFPASIGCLTELRRVDARECNIKSLPAEIWFCSKLEELNLSSNVLDSFPKLSPSLQPPMMDPMSAKSNNSLQSSFMSQLSQDESGTNGGDEAAQRRPSQASGSMFSYGSSPATSTRKNSVMSTSNYNSSRKQSMPSRHNGSETNGSGSHKDSNANTRAPTFSSSLKSLHLADNRLTDEVFESFLYLTELRLLNVSYNDLDDIPPNILRRFTNLQELYLSGNELASLPTDDLGNLPNLRSLFLNGNKFQTLPAEIAKLSKLTMFDVGCNILRYNVANWPYDWNWVWNPNLRYLNFSGNRRLEIKPANNSNNTYGARDEVDLTSFQTLQSLRTLGLIDVTLTIPHVPDETENRRVRTTGSTIGTLRYGMADSLGKLEHLSTLDLLIPKFRHDGEVLVGMFDGQPMSSGGSRVSRFLQENFKYYFSQHLVELMTGEDAGDALRRTFLTMNKDLITFSTSNWEQTETRFKATPIKHPASAHQLIPDDRNCGSVATVLFLQDMDLYVANVGNIQAILVPSDGSLKSLTKKHEPADPSERERIRQAGGYVSRYGRLNDTLDVSRAFGCAQYMPAVMAAPHVQKVTLREKDEMVLIATKEFWDYVTPDLAIDVARSERDDPMRAAQKLRDLAIAFGGTNKIMVMVLGVSGLKRRERSHNRNTMLTSPAMEHVHAYSRKSRKQRDTRPDDSTLARLDKEIDAPTGEIALVFTDIKSSTALWEKSPAAMRLSIKMHNELMRRQLRYIGGYEVKTEGDAFMIAFPTPTSALLWCFAVQNSLLEQQWPAEILESPHGAEVHDDDGILIYRGLSVRMGIHWGAPDCETDPITRRMDYFGPIVNRAARIQGVADGGEITCSSEFIAEIERTLEIYADNERQGSTGSDDTILDDSMGPAIRQNLVQLSEQGFEVKDMGEKKLKGLENPELLFLIYPHTLAGRQSMAENRKQAAIAQANGAEPAAMQAGSNLAPHIEPQHIWDLWALSLRLELLCSALEDPSPVKLKSPETAILERMRTQGGEVNDTILVQFVEHLVCRVETCVNVLAIRNLVRPFAQTSSLFETAGPSGDIFSDLTSKLKELEVLKKEKELRTQEA